MNTLTRKFQSVIAMPTGFITTQEVAEKLGFNVKSIPKMLRDKLLEGERFGRVWLVSEKSVTEYIKQTKARGKRDMRYKNKGAKKK